MRYEIVLVVQLLAYAFWPVVRTERISRETDHVPSLSREGDEKQIGQQEKRDRVQDDGTIQVLRRLQATFLERLLQHPEGNVDFQNPAPATSLKTLIKHEWLHLNYCRLTEILFMLFRDTAF